MHVLVAPSALGLQHPRKGQEREPLAHGRRREGSIARVAGLELVLVQLLGQIALERRRMHERNVVALDRILDRNLPVRRMLAALP